MNKKLLDRAIKDEKAAPKSYRKLIREVPSKDKPLIRKIILDERRHLSSLKQLKRRLK